MATVLSAAFPVIALGSPAAESGNPAAGTSPAAPEPELDPSRVTPGLLGFLTFVFLLICAFFLYRSLRKQLKRVDFNENSERAATHHDQPVD